MALDVTFYRKEKDADLGVFWKMNFLLTYFEVERNDEEIEIPKEYFEKFISDLDKELSLEHKSDKYGQMPPKNERFSSCRVLFGGNMDYDQYYWDSMKEVRDWAKKTMETFDWEKYDLFVRPSW